MRKIIGFIVMLGIVFPFAAKAQTPVVKVDGGMLAGSTIAGGSVITFAGVPFAAPPTGAFRWRPPQPAAPWQGIREAFHFAPACMQIIPPTGSFYQHEFFPTAEPQSEDCLYLNIWAPAVVGAAPRPVMVWFFGGGFNQGSGSLPSFDGTLLARKGAIVVTINYRVGAFGFLAHPELDAESAKHVSGNYGLLDQIAALQWVKANIASFGGDPARVTIFGQSAGALSVGYQMASPLAKGLFRRAIAESDPMFGMAAPTMTLAQAEDGGKRLVSALAAPSIAALREMPASELMTKVGTRYVDFGLRPNIDGWLIPKDIPEVVAAGQENNDALLLGTNADEGTELLAPTTPEGLAALIQQRFGPQAQALSRLFHGDDAAQATPERLPRHNRPCGGGDLRASRPSRLRLSLQQGRSRL